MATSQQLLKAQKNPERFCIQNLSKLNELTKTVAVSDLIGDIVTTEDISNAVALLTVAYGKEYAEEYAEKIQLLFSMVLEDGWTGKRFIETLRWIIKTRPYRDWSIADFFSAPTAQLVCYEQAGKGFIPYRVGDLILWAEPSVHVPFEKVVAPNPVQPEQTKEQTEQDEKDFDVTAFLALVKSKMIR